MRGTTERTYLCTVITVSLYYLLSSVVTQRSAAYLAWHAERRNAGVYCDRPINLSLQYGLRVLSANVILQATIAIASFAPYQYGQLTFSHHAQRKATPQRQRQRTSNDRRLGPPSSDSKRSSIQFSWRWLVRYSHPFTCNPMYLSTRKL